MSDNWQILELNSLCGELRFDSKTRLLEIIDAKTGEIASNALDNVNILFVGVKVKLSSAILYHLAKHDVVVICCDWKGHPVCAMYPWTDAHSRVGARQRAQASLALPRAKNAWMRVIKAKIRGQANNLKHLSRKNTGLLSDLCSKVRSGDPANMEARAAKVYWSSLFEGEGFTRRPGESFDERNSLLDYGYTILRGHSIRAVLSAGLNPALGIFHRGRSNQFALADDLIEPFRPAIDLAVAMLPQQSLVIDKATRKYLVDAALGSFDKSGLSIGACMIDLAQQYGRYIEGEISRLDVVAWNPADIKRSDSAEMQGHEGDQESCHGARRSKVDIEEEV